VRSRSESASLAEVAASMRSSQRLYWLAGSAEEALPRLSRLEYSFDFVLSCFGLRAWVRDDFRGRDLGTGGRVVDLPGGDLAIIDGNSSRGRGEGKELNDS
jgi:hypothetical protein